MAVPFVNAVKTFTVTTGYDRVLRPAETLAFNTNDTFYKRLQLRFDYGRTNRKSRTLSASRVYSTRTVLVAVLYSALPDILGTT